MWAGICTLHDSVGYQGFLLLSRYPLLNQSVYCTYTLIVCLPIPPPHIILFPKHFFMPPNHFVFKCSFILPPRDVAMNSFCFTTVPSINTLLKSPATPPVTYIILGINLTVLIAIWNVSCATNLFVCESLCSLVMILHDWILFITSTQ